MSNSVDQLAVERFTVMIESEPFRRLQQRIGEMLQRERRRVETETDTAHLFRAQGKCAALREVLALPSAVLGELRVK